ncbi:hypothetical protein GCM10010168_27110 [Actinoplanes ianthinogenes]|uniref:Phage protein D n=1 Tax=Actinoplanes ianthinogenes TaxID=122358 RepID=A0ABN6C5M9_9ACTN|nr:phage late control D family protein [Actinoplanes ianthinogenes]BCJ39851.1 hypothetical protein Aiant_05080 [Actinoplanes ianthinogenes]GGR08579.1 hypothetical protein GCM10010168_27110 [Actinoplanes ianthinogenes]
MSGTYVPAFTVRRVREGGTAAVVRSSTDLDAELLADVLSLTVVDDLAEIDTFTLRVARHPDAFEVGQRYDIHLGYRDDLHPVMTGYVTAVTATFPQSGGQTLTVQGQDVFFRGARREQHSDRWLQKTDSFIAGALGGRRNPAKPGFDCPVRIDEQTRQGEAEHPRVVMRNQSTLSFLAERARLNGYAFFVGHDDTGYFVHFGPSERLPGPGPELRWGRDLLAARTAMRLDTAARSVEVRWWDRQQRRDRRLRATPASAGLTVNRDLYDLLDAAGEDRTISDRVVRTAAEARQLARNYLAESVKGLVELDATVVGRADLRAGGVVRIAGLDRRVDGRYFVTRVTHHLDEQGYRTELSARREVVS